jgi:transcriptional regulator with GAF, ATPase, and Fis domain
MITDHHFDIGEGPVRSANNAPIKEWASYESLRQATDTFQRDYISHVIDDSQGNWANAARALGVDSGNLHRLAKRLGLK